MTPSVTRAVSLRTYDHDGGRPIGWARIPKAGDGGATMVNTTAYR